MSAAAERADCFAKVVELLGRRPHFREELRRKLAAREFAAAEIEWALERAESLGYLAPEAELAAAFARERVARQGLGRARIARELTQRGAGSEAIAAALDALGEGDELERARRAAERWARRGTDAAALARHLSRKGFARSVIFRVSREFAREGEELPADDD